MASGALCHNALVCTTRPRGCHSAHVHGSHIITAQSGVGNVQLSVNECWQAGRSGYDEIVAVSRFLFHWFLPWSFSNVPSGSWQCEGPFWVFSCISSLSWYNCTLWCISLGGFVWVPNFLETDSYRGRSPSLGVVFHSHLFARKSFFPTDCTPCAALSPQPYHSPEGPLDLQGQHESVSTDSIPSWCLQCLSTVLDPSHNYSPNVNLGIFWTL